MALIHRTTMVPSKLDHLTAWLPTRSWYVHRGRDPEPAKAGGWRLDDPAGEVGLEFMAVTDGERTYQAPLTYRGAPLPGAEDALIGTSEHGVLGTRWIYDGARDPVLLTQLLALFLGRAEPQAQSLTDTPDPTVHAHWTGPAADSVAPDPSVVTVTDTAHGTEAVLRTALQPGGPVRELTLHFARVLPGKEAAEAGRDGGPLGHVTADWTAPDGSGRRGRYVEVWETGGR